MVTERMVEVGPIADGLRVIRSGLSPSDTIVIDGVQRARPGHKVQVRQGTITAVAPQGPANVTTPLSTSAKIADQAN